MGYSLWTQLRAILAKFEAASLVRAGLCCSAPSGDRFAEQRTNNVIALR
ncbi:MAG: hypothetical protein R6U43_11115 [Candidatus Krumholzibacteriales bacterium]